MRQMKDSGISWIGEVPENWGVLRNKNGFLCSKTLVGEDSQYTQLLSLTTKGIKEKDIKNPEGKLPESFDTYQLVEKNNIVMCLFDLDCSAVFSGISPYDGMISPAYKVLRCRNNMLPKYADYWFRYVGDGRKFNHYAKNLRYTLNYEEFSSLPLLIPPVVVQNRIADYLDSKCSQIDSIIEKQEAIIDKLKEYKLRIITEAISKGLNTNVEMKDSGNPWIGNIPDSVSITRCGHLYKIVLGKMLANEQSSPSDTLENYFCAANVHFDGIDDNNLKKMWFSTKDKTIYKISKGSLLVVEGGAGAGGAAIAEKDYNDCYAQNSILIVNGANTTYNKWLYYTLFSIVNNGYIGVVCNKATIPHFTKDKLSNVPVVCFPEEEMERIIQELDFRCSEIDKTISEREKIINKYSELEKSLIFEVVTGKKEV